MTLEGETPMNSTSNTKDDLIARAYDQIARADEELARVSQQISGIGRDAVHEPSIGSAAQPSRRRLARRGLVGLLSAVCIVGIVAIKNPTVFCTTRFTPRSSDRGGGSTAASSTVVPHGTAGRCYGCPGGFRPDTVAAKGDGRYRKPRA